MCFFLIFVSFIPSYVEPVLCQFKKIIGCCTAVKALVFSINPICTKAEFARSGKLGSKMAALAYDDSGLFFQILRNSHVLDPKSALPMPSNIKMDH